MTNLFIFFMQSHISSNIESSTNRGISSDNWSNRSGSTWRASRLFLSFFVQSHISSNIESSTDRRISSDNWSNRSGSTWRTCRLFLSFFEQSHSSSSRKTGFHIDLIPITGLSLNWDSLLRIFGCEFIECITCSRISRWLRTRSCNKMRRNMFVLFSFIQSHSSTGSVSNLPRDVSTNRRWIFYRVIIILFCFHFCNMGGIFLQVFSQFFWGKSCSMSFSLIFLLFLIKRWNILLWAFNLFRLESLE